MDFESDFLESKTLGNQFILAKVGRQRIAFPAEYVSGILLADKSHILSLPFYHESILGIVHYQGQLVALMMLQHLLEGSPAPSREAFNAVQLNESSGAAGLGLIVDQLLGNCGEEQLLSDDSISLFKTDILSANLWKPKRWISLVL